MGNMAKFKELISIYEEDTSSVSVKDELICHLVNEFPCGEFKRLSDKYSSFEEKQGPNKYIVQYKEYIERDLNRALSLHLHKKSSLNILDIGSGFGWFGLICRELGHAYVGLDDGSVPLYTESFSSLNMERSIQRILPFQLLPVFKEKFDLVTCFQISFDLYPGCYNWGVGEWTYFMHDLAQYTRNDTFDLVIEFNQHGAYRYGKERRVSEQLENWFLRHTFSKLDEYTVYASLNNSSNIPYKLWFTFLSNKLVIKLRLCTMVRKIIQKMRCK